MPSRMMCGSMTKLGTPGIRLTVMPASTRISGAGILSFGASDAAAEITSAVTTSRMTIVCIVSLVLRRELRVERHRRCYLTASRRSVKLDEVDVGRDAQRVD